MSRQPFWETWHGSHPPVTLIPELFAGKEPFGSSMLWLHARVREVMQQVMPFAARYMVEQRRAKGMDRDPAHETSILLQPVVHALFLEWVATQTDHTDAGVVVQNFAQFCASAAYATMAPTMPTGSKPQ